MGWLARCLAVFLIPTALAAEEVDLALVLAADISYSVGPEELDLQRRGYVAAFRSPDVIRAMTGGPNRRIAVAYLEWAGPGTQAEILPWTIIDSPRAARALADALEDAALHRSGETSISAALDSAATLLATAPPALRHVIDLSSDGYNNSGAPVLEARARTLAQGITINGLPILTAEAPDLDTYFRACVVGGPGAILYPVHRPEDFATTLRRKMVTEISGLAPARLINANLPAPVDCLHGEKKMREDYLRQLDDITNGRSQRWQPREQDWPTPE